MAESKAPLEIRILRSFDRDFGRLPKEIRERANDQIRRLAARDFHPSLRLKKMEGHPDIWEVRVSRNYRMTLQFDEGAVILRRVGTHDVLRTP